MKHVLIFITLMLMVVVGCAKNPVSSNSSTLKYILSTAKKTYTASDTLHFTLTVHNVGFTTDTVAVGDALLCTWSLKNASGGVMYSGEDPTGNLIGLIPVVPGESIVIERWTHGLTDSTGSPLPVGSYTFAVDYSDHLTFIALNVM